MEQIVIGIIAGAAWGTLGYLKQLPKKKKKDVEDFDLKKFLKAPVIGAVVGAYASYTGSVDFATAQLSLASVGVMAVLDNILTGLFKAIKLKTA